jgi:hypothetical protein
MNSTATESLPCQGLAGRDIRKLSFPQYLQICAFDRACGLCESKYCTQRVNKKQCCYTSNILGVYGKTMIDGSDLFGRCFHIATGFGIRVKP